MSLETAQVHELLRAAIEKNPYSSVADAIRLALAAYEGRIWLANHPDAPYAPWGDSDLMDYPVDAEGHIILEIPAIEDCWYHKSDYPEEYKLLPYGPIAFHMEKPIEVFETTSGYVADISPTIVDDWSKITKYRLWVSLEDIDDLGMF